MIKINAIPLDYEPRNKILPRLPEYVDPKGRQEPEMSEFESAFLCGVIKKFRPNKILEVGVAAGGSTAIILQALEDIGEPYEMHSVDSSVGYYRDPRLTTGFLATFAKENNLFAPLPQSTLHGNHEFHLGKYLPQVIDSIGNDIDFVILDTRHILPGEVFDFLAVMPYLKTGAVVVIHDVSGHQINSTPWWIGAYATCILFGAVTADKFLNFQHENSLFRYPNIATFQINECTAANIENVFLTLILRWKYLPSEKQLLLYRNHYRRFYSTELCEIFQEAIDMNAYNFYLASRK